MSHGRAVFCNKVWRREERMQCGCLVCSFYLISPFNMACLKYKGFLTYLLLYQYNWTLSFIVLCRCMSRFMLSWWFLVSWYWSREIIFDIVDRRWARILFGLTLSRWALGFILRKIISLFTSCRMCRRVCCSVLSFTYTWMVGWVLLKIISEGVSLILASCDS